MAKTILLVDDSATSRMKSRMILGKQSGYEFISACDGKEGVEMALSATADGSTGLRFRRKSETFFFRRLGH